MMITTVEIVVAAFMIWLGLTGVGVLIHFAIRLVGRRDKDLVIQCRMLDTALVAERAENARLTAELAKRGAYR